MGLWEDVENVCKEMLNNGWNDILLPHKMDLGASDLRKELLKTDIVIDRTATGFEDFHRGGIQAIEPRNPAQSLLYHALASPRVPLPGEKEKDTSKFRHSELRKWIEIIENGIYGLEPPTLEALEHKAAGKPLALVVFAYEYRSASLTPHRQYADLCFSRTGVARIGTTDAKYDPRARAFCPFIEENARKIPVMPVRYGAFIAVREQGSADVVGESYVQKGDIDRFFWVPLHKVFPGSECLAGIDNLTVDFKTYHINEKLRRFHLKIQDEGFPAGWAEPFLSHPPFVIKEGIADLKAFLLSDEELSAGQTIPKPPAGTVFLVPEWKDHLVTPATYKQRKDQKSDASSTVPLTFRVPVNYATSQNEATTLLFSSLRLRAIERDGQGELRAAPEFTNARNRVGDTPPDLNLLPNVKGVVMTGGYEAQHFIDYTADGWVTVDCSALTKRVIPTYAAYSIVAPPDFLPCVNQRQVSDWWNQKIPRSMQNNIWNQPPDALADQRFAPNIHLSGSHFLPDDQTMTAIVTSRPSPTGIQETIVKDEALRVSFLPDGAAGVFAPGWDIARDKEGMVEFLATYGGGSPFIEDSLSCAALSSFWPAAAPDTARRFPPTKSRARPTVVPLTDHELGFDGGAPWDGLIPPKRVPEKIDQKDWMRYLSVENADYVTATLNDDFSLEQLSKISVEQYTNRALAMQQVYSTLGIDLTTPDRNKQFAEKGGYIVLMFREVDDVLDKAEMSEFEEKQTGIDMPDYRFRWEVFVPGETRPDPDDMCFRLVEITSLTILYTLGLHTFWKREKATEWQHNLGLF